MAKEERKFSPELLARAGACAKRAAPDSELEDDEARAVAQKSVAAERKKLAAQFAPRLAAMEERLAPPAAGKYKVTALHACRNKILGEFAHGESKVLSLSAAHVDEFMGSHQPFKLTVVKEQKDA